MAVISTGNHPKALWPGIHEFWGRAYAKHPEEYSKLFDMQTSEKQYEEDVEVTGFGLAPVKSEGMSVIYDSEVQGFITRYMHVAYALGYIVTHEELEDNLYEVVSKRRAEALAFSMKQTKEIVAANVYNNGFSTSYPIGDGAALLSLSHPTTSGNQQNMLTISADISEASLEDMTVLIMQMTNDKGLHIAALPDSVIVPPTLWYEANRILKSDNQYDSANNAVNVLKANKVFPGGVVLNHFLTGASAWFLRTNIPHGMTGFQRAPLKFEMDNDFDTMNAKAKAYERYSFGCTDWRGIFGSQGA